MSLRQVDNGSSVVSSVVSAIAAILIAAAAIYSAGAMADTPTCTGLLTIHTNSKSIPALQGQEYCLTVIPAGADDSEFGGLSLTGPGANEKYTLSQLRVGAIVERRYPDLLRISVSNLKPATGGGGSVSYIGTHGEPGRENLKLFKKSGKWMLKQSGELIDTMELVVEFEKIGGETVPVIARLELAQRDR